MQIQNRNIIHLARDMHAEKNLRRAKAKHTKYIRSHACRPALPAVVTDLSISKTRVFYPQLLNSDQVREHQMPLSGFRKPKTSTSAKIQLCCSYMPVMVPGVVVGEEEVRRSRADLETLSRLARIQSRHGRVGKEKRKTSWVKETSQAQNCCARCQISEPQDTVFNIF